MTRKEAFEMLMRGESVTVTAEDVKEYRNFYTFRNSINASMRKLGKRVSSKKNDAGWTMTAKEGVNAEQRCDP